MILPAHHPSVQCQGVLRRRAPHLAGHGSTALRYGRARHHRRVGQSLQGTLTAGTKGDGCYSFSNGRRRALVCARQCRQPQGRGLGSLGNDQLEMAGGLPQGHIEIHAVVLCAHIRCGRCIRNGLGHRRMAPALSTTSRFWLGDGAQRPHPPVMQKVEVQRPPSTPRSSTAFPQPATGTAPSPGRDEGRRCQLRTPAVSQHNFSRTTAARHHRHAAGRLKREFSK